MPKNVAISHAKRDLDMLLLFDMSRLRIQLQERILNFKFSKALPVLEIFCV
jgi:hypothetical protein